MPDEQPAQGVNINTPNTEVPLSTPDTQTPDEPPLKSRSKKTLITSIILLVLLGVGAALTYEFVNANKYRDRLNKYQTTGEFNEYSKALRAFLDDDNGREAKFYTCQATLTMLWYPGSQGAGGYSQPAVSINKIRENWQKVEPNLPVYRGFVFASVLPQAKTAQRKYDQTRELLTQSKSLMYMSDLMAYCPYHLYSDLGAYSYLDEFSRTNTVIRENPDALQQRLDNAKKSKAALSNITVPPEMADVHQNLMSFYEKMAIDLAVLVNARKSSPGGVANMGSSFASNKDSLEKQVLAKAAEAGRQIKPSPAELDALLRNATGP